MNRRKFLQHGAMAAMAVSVAPAAVLAATKFDGRGGIPVPAVFGKLIMTPPEAIGATVEWQTSRVYKVGDHIFVSGMCEPLSGTWTVTGVSKTA